jgi:hypothetical protein
VWYELIKNFPEKKVWIAHNKTIPYEILEYLSERLNSFFLLVLNIKN